MNCEVCSFYYATIKHHISYFPEVTTGVCESCHKNIHSGRCPEFLKQQTRKQVVKFLHAQGITGMVVIGGDGSFRGAAALQAEGGPKAIGIPATIDNDIIGTDYALGFDTARNTGLQAIDKIRDTSKSSNRYFLVEVMGRKAGFLAVDVGIAGGVDHILTPEFPISTEELARQINAPMRKKQSLIIVVAEAGESGRSLKMANKLSKLTPFEYRVCVLGHIQRGGAPTVLDREIGSRMGNLAVEALLEDKTNCMTAMQNGKLQLVPFSGPDAPCRLLQNDDLLKLSEVLST